MNEQKRTRHRVTMPEDMALEYLDKLLVLVNKQFLDPGFPIALSMAIDKMRAPLSDNKALTVEELRGMDGEPVRVEEDGEYQYGLVSLSGCALAPQGEVITLCSGDFYLLSEMAGNYEVYSIAFRRPPEKGET